MNNEKDNVDAQDLSTMDAVEASQHGLEDKVEDKDQNSETAVAEDDPAYPPFKVVLPAMAAIYLALFLVAVVRNFCY